MNSIDRLNAQIDSLIFSVSRVQRVLEEVLIKQTEELERIQKRGVYHTDRLNEFAFQILKLSDDISELKRKIEKNGN